MIFPVLDKSMCQYDLAQSSLWVPAEFAWQKFKEGALSAQYGDGKRRFNYFLFEICLFCF